MQVNVPCPRHRLLLPSGHPSWHMVRLTSPFLAAQLPGQEAAELVFINKRAIRHATKPSFSPGPAASTQAFAAMLKDVSAGTTPVGAAAEKAKQAISILPEKE